MDEAERKTALRMIPYGIYVMTALGADNAPAGATVNCCVRKHLALVACWTKGPIVLAAMPASIGCVTGRPVP